MCHLGAEALKISVQLTVILCTVTEILWKSHVEMKPLRAWKPVGSKPQEFPR